MLRVRLNGPPVKTGRRPADAKGGGKGAGRFRGPENLLYRIEVHEGGPAGRATFKWSRENGALLLALTSLSGTVAHVAPAARQEASRLTPGVWVELSDILDRALGRSSAMVQVKTVDVHGRIELSAAPADGEDQRPGDRLGLRRWDQSSIPGVRGVQAGPKGMPIVEGENEAHWLDIEDGIQIQFQAGADPPHQYRVGDYWLIPARTADEGMLLRSHTWEPPDGPLHRYAPLGLFVPSIPSAIADFRPTFQPLAALQDQVNALSDALEELRKEMGTLRK
jgi:hypothetical protein